MTVSNQIFSQLGGNMFAAMTGATLLSDTNALIVKFKGSRVANYMKVKLNANDLYDVEFKKIRGMNVKDVNEYNNIYSEQLRTIFENETKLYTRL